MTLSSFLTKFRSCGGKLIKIKQKDKYFVKVSVKGLKMTLAYWIWTIWMTSTTAAFVGHLPHFLSSKIWPSNVKLYFYQVHCSWKNLSCISAVSDKLICGKVCLDIFYLLLRSKSASWIHTQACSLHHMKNMEQNVKHNFGMKNKIGHFFRTTLYILKHLISFNMITNKSEAKPMIKHTLCDCKCKLYNMKFKSNMA